MRHIVANETGRTLVLEDFGIDWVGLGYTLFIDTVDRNNVLRTATVLPSGSYPHGGQVIGTESIFPVSGDYNCIVYEENDLYISDRFKVPVGEGHFSE